MLSAYKFWGGNILQYTVLNALHLQTYSHKWWEGFMTPCTCTYWNFQTQYFTLELTFHSTVPYMAHRTTLFSHVYSYWLVFALKHYSIAGLILLIILRGHMLGFGNKIVLRQRYFCNFHVSINFMLKMTLGPNRKNGNMIFPSLSCL